MPISVVFDPPLPSDSPSTFNTKAFTLLGDLNDWSTQANALPGEVATNLTTLLAAPPTIGSTTPAAGSFTTLSASGNAAFGAMPLATLGGQEIVAFGPNANVMAENFGGANTTINISQNASFASGAWLRISTDFAANYYQNLGAHIWRYAASGAAGSAITWSTGLSISNAGAVTIPGSVSTGALSASGNAVIGNGGANASVNVKSSVNDLGAGNSELLLGNATQPTSGYVSYSHATHDLLLGTAGATRVTVGGAGAVTIPGATSFTGGTFGYGTGAGGTVTQATSKSTDVTLNKPSGQITMHNAALAAGDFESFYFYNSYITDTSVLLVQGIHDGTVNPANYTISCVQIYGATNRSFIKVVNISAGSLSEAVVLRFAVISGANA